MNVSPKACFKSLKGVASSQLYTITAIQPIVHLIDRIKGLLNIMM